MIADIITKQNNVSYIKEELIEYLYGLIRFTKDEMKIICKSPISSRCHIGYLEHIILEKVYMVVKVPEKPGPHPLSEKKRLMQHFTNMVHDAELLQYYEKVRNYAIYLFSQIDGLSFEDKNNDFRGHFGLDLLYRDTCFSMVWECPYYYLDKFAEIMGPNQSMQRLDLDDFPNIKDYLDKFF
jgi:hypothetical protein